MRKIIRLSLAFLICLALVLGVYTTAQAREAIVTLKDGRQVTGELVSETDQDIELKISGITARFNKSDIESVVAKMTVEEQYRERRAKLADDDIANRTKLVNWLNNLNSNDGLKFAKIEVDDLIRRAPDDGNVKILKSIIDQKIKQAAAPKEVKPDAEMPTPPVKPEAPTATEPKGDGKLPDTLLTEEQINLIKIYMIEPRDKPAVTVPKDVIQELFDKYGDHELVPKGRTDRMKVLGLRGYEQLDLLFSVRARDLYPKVTVQTDPLQVKTFRAGIHQNYVLNYCGTAKCHGGEEAGNFFLFFKAPVNRDDVVYTNFYILRAWDDERGFMVDLERPSRSYLLQYGMERESAATPHPDVKGWQPLIRNLKSSQYEQVTDWILSLGLEQTFPANIEYELPTVAKPAAETEADAAPVN